MKKNPIMRKNSFVKGAFITTLGIVITKILGILYVIPFHAIIGEKGGALYGYAYTIYLVFMSLSSAGIPLAISKIISEYQTMGYINAKKRAFILGKRIALILGFICFLIIMLFAPYLAKIILGNVTGGNSIEDISFVIRVIGTAILIVPLLSVYRGYFEGHRFMSPPSVSQVIEQIIRVFIVIFGSLIAIKCFKFNLGTSVGVALFGATVGALVSYLYLVDMRIKNKKKFNEKLRDVNEPIITDKMILKKIFYYAIPFIMIDIFKSLYNYIDMTTVVKGLVNYAYFSSSDAEVIYSMLSTWCAKFNMIVLAISTGIVVSLIPNLTESIVKKDRVNINKKICQALSILLFFTVPMSVGISFLSSPIWNLFYGTSTYGPSVLSYYIFVGLFGGLFTILVTILQTMKDYKSVFISLISGVIIKLLLNYKLIIAFRKMSMPPYYGVITATIIGYLVSFIICIVVLKAKFNINYEEVIKHFFEILFGTVIMIIILFIISLVIPLNISSRIGSLFIILFYSVVGAIIYFLYLGKTGVIKSIFGNNVINSFRKIVFKK